MKYLEQLLDYFYQMFLNLSIFDQQFIPSPLYLFTNGLIFENLSECDSISQ